MLNSMGESALSAPRRERRRAILESAIREFAQHGFFNARISEIAAGAGVAEGTIYLYFESKDDLLLTAFRDAVHEFCGSVSDLLASSLPFPERLQRFIQLQFERIEADPALATVLLLESRQTSKFYGGAVRDVLRTYAAAIEELLGNGVASGAVRDEVDIPMARRMLIGVLEEVELEWLLSDQSRPLLPAAEEVATLFYRGIAL